MPSLRMAVAFTAAAAAALRAQPGAGWDRPRTMFTLEPLQTTGKLPCAGDLVADLRLTDRVWRVEQRLLLMAALAASPDLRTGDVVRDTSFSRHMFFIEERLFLWTAANAVHVRYLVDVGMKAGEWEQLRQ